MGRLLLAARRDSPDLHHEFVFQSRGDSADITWHPGDPVNRLPNCDAVIALWGATSGNQQDLDQNARLATLTADLARGLGARRVVHLSSAAVYGPGQMMNEDRPTENCNSYGKSKLDMEVSIDMDRRRTGLAQIALRLANVVGADSLAPVLRGERPALIDDFSADPKRHLGPLRSYIGAKGLLQIFDALLTLPPETWPNVLNVAAPAPVAMDALARAAGQAVIWQKAPESAVAEVTLDVSRLQTLLPNITPAATASDLIAEWRRLESLA